MCIQLSVCTPLCVSACICLHLYIWLKGLVFFMFKLLEATTLTQNIAEPPKFIFLVSRQRI